MAGRLVTIATFELSTQAHIARNALEAAHIPVTLNNEESTSLFGQGTPVLSGIRLVVREEDEEAAVKVLDATFDNSEAVSAEELAAQAEATEPEEPLPGTAEPSRPKEEEQAKSERDAYARRLWLAVFFGFAMPLLWFYAVYLFLNAAFGDGSLSDRSKNKLLVVGGPMFLFVLFVIFPMVVVDVIFLFWLCGRLFG